MAQPLVGISAAVERASFGSWTDEPAALLPVTYVRAVQGAGGMVSLLPPDAVAVERPDELLERLDALILGGGADIDVATYGAEAHAETVGTNPERDRFEIALARRALERDLPLLGVCRGLQVMNIAAGGTLEQHLPDRIGNERHRPVPGKWAEHDVRLEPGSLAAEAAGGERLRVKSHHHQGVAELGDGLTVSGWSTDDDTIEALEVDDRGFALGVLWHPEEDPDDGVIPSLLDSARRA